MYHSILKEGPELYKLHRSEYKNMMRDLEVGSFELAGAATT